MENPSSYSQRDPDLWRIAKKRAGFKTSLYTYLIVNAFLWILWAFSYETDGHLSIWEIWPIWPTLGWGLGIAFQYFDAYRTKSDLIEREYKKLLRERRN